MKCNECKYFDKFNNQGGGCHAYPPKLFKDGDEISEHRPWVNFDAVACSLFKPVEATIGELVG